MATKKPVAKKAPARKTPVKKPIVRTTPVKRAGRKPADEELVMDEPKQKKITVDIASIYSDTLDVIAKRQGFESSSLDVAPPMSTTLLCVDMLLGGGLRACMVTGAGEEQCAKTTLALVAMAAAIKENIPIIAFVDYEGSTKNSKPYVASILKGAGVKMSVDEVFGKKSKDPKAKGAWEIRPRVRYRSETTLEVFYDWLSEILRDLPDKRFVQNKWWLIFDADKKKGWKVKLGSSVDEAMTKRYGNGIWMEAPDDKMQAIIFVDSYTAMMPKVKDEEDIGNQLSVKASAFSKQLERVKGRMADKMVTVYGLNHLRDNPMAAYGPKQTEKGGKALMQFSDVRLRQTSRALSAAPFSPKANKQFNEVEMSVEFPGCEDEYRYVHVKALKNKLWTPGRQTLIRIWVEDGNGVARGIDPVFDTIMYLKDTGQLIGTRKAFKLKLGDLGVSASLTWQDIKLWILGDKEAMTKISKKAGYKPMSLRTFCFKQVKTGVAEDKYIATKNAGKAAKAAKVASGEASEDDDNESED